MADSPASSLSSIITESSSSDHEEAKPDTPSASNLPPSKRRRTGMASWDRQTPMSALQDDIPPSSPASTISSDTSGELPTDHATLALLGSAIGDDDYSGQGNDQVTICRWEGCEAGDQGNMDELVRHIHDAHVGSRQKKYSCEWVDCSRKGQTHASGYALRAHMRSHTREKPFYCALPECDRSFTRSDALAKHMRTVHETEALRPSDPVPKHHNPALPALGGTATPTSKLQRIKLKLSHPPKDEADQYGDSDVIETEDLDEIELPELAPEVGFDEHELSLRSMDLYRLLRRQIFWAEKESVELRKEWERIQPKRKEAWREKEGIFDDVIDAELRLFSAIVGSEGVGALGAADVTHGLEKFQQQQRQAQQQAASAAGPP